MELFPAVDIRGAQVVRLTRGDYNQMEVYGSDPKSAAQNFLAQGAKNLHVVDLDGAKEGTDTNLKSIREICSLSELFIEVGGGIRDEKRVARYLELGAGRVILGTAAVRNFSFVEEMVKKYGDQIAVGVDAKEGLVAVSGWLETTALDSFSFCKQLSEAGVKTVIYTDIAKDGALSGTNLEAYRHLRNIPALQVVASGGISDVQDILALKQMGTYGAIVGKALYVGKLTLEEALMAAKGESI